MTQQMGAIRSIHTSPSGQFCLPHPPFKGQGGEEKDDTGERYRPLSINCCLTMERRARGWAGNDPNNHKPYECRVTVQTRVQPLQLFGREDKPTEGTGPLREKARSLWKKLTEALTNRKTKNMGMSPFY